MSEEGLPNIALMAVEREETCRLESYIWPSTVSCTAIFNSVIKEVAASTRFKISGTINARDSVAPNFMMHGPRLNQVSRFFPRYRTTPYSTTGKTLTELLSKRHLRNRLTLLRTDTENIVVRLQQEQYNRATTNVLELIPERTVSVFNTRQNNGGKYLWGVIKQRSDSIIWSMFMELIVTYT